MNEIFSSSADDAAFHALFTGNVVEPKYEEVLDLNWLKVRSMHADFKFDEVQIGFMTGFLPLRGLGKREGFK